MTREILYLIATAYLRLQKYRIQLTNRIKSLKRSRKITKAEGERLHKWVDRTLKRAEREIAEDMAKEVEVDLVYTKYLGKLKGIGMSLACQILGLIGDIKRFNHFQDFQKYVGWHVTPYGTVPRKERGKKGEADPERKALFHKVMDQFIKNKNPDYYPIYQKYKEMYGGMNKPTLVDLEKAKGKILCESIGP